MLYAIFFHFSIKKMNIYASDKKNFVQYTNVQMLFRELYNVCKIYEAEGHFFYCYCNRKGNQCYLCKFSDFLHYNKKDKYLLIHRNNENKLLEVVDEFCFYISKIKMDDQGALDFFNKEYTLNFKDYRNHIYISMDFDQVIKSSIESIEANSIEKYCKHF